MIHALGGRRIRPEILDTLAPAQARASLADVVRLNAHWGGHATLRRLFRGMLRPEGAFTVLDVGAASGDMGRQIRSLYPDSRVTSLDYLESHLEAADRPKVAGDAFGLPFADGSFDYVFCSLFLHHFTDDQVATLLAGFGKVARRAVLVIDLERNPIAYYFVPWTRWLLGWDPVTVHDAPASVEAGFKPRELEQLARRAGLRNVRAKVFRPAFRIALIGETPGQ